MKPLTPAQIQRIAAQYGSVDGLADELGRKLSQQVPTAAFAVPGGRLMAAARAIVETVVEAPLIDEVEERIIAKHAGARPVARIRGNEVMKEFIGPDSQSWGAVIEKYRNAIDAAVPAVGRIELNNSDYPWAGTGWLVADDIIVTNRHVATLFAERARGAGFVFKPGLLDGNVSSDIDFLEEENRLDSVEHPIVSILWIAGATEADVAFLQVARAPRGPALPKAIPLARSEATAGQLVGAIGYPARDPSIPDQKLVTAIFGDDVYDKKRFAPGKVMSVNGTVLKHDCSTLGGNSGSVLLDLASGEAVGLHRAGLVDDSANLAVTAAHVRELLTAARQQPPVVIEKQSKAAGPVTPVLPPGLNAGWLPDPSTPGLYRSLTYIPIEVTVRVGSPQGWPQIAPASPPTIPTMVPSSLDQAVAEVQRRSASDDNVLEVRAGYRFKNGWITDEQVVVVEVREKRSPGALRDAGQTPLPAEIGGVGIDVRTASLPDQLDGLGLDVEALVERPGRPAGYSEPRGYDDPSSEMYLGRVKEKMSVIFHVSPDAGFVNLTQFFGRVKNTLTATIYEWGHDGISNALAAAIQTGTGKTLRMVTQKRGVTGGEATEKAVTDMKARLGAKFKHVWASVRGPRRLIPSSYHIKVASRDGEEVWLSSGNWKESNQPETADASRPTALKKFNREWHAIIENKRLATLFQKYIEFDFREATRVPLEEGEAPALPEVELFVPDSALTDAEERVPGVSYQDTLRITDEVLDAQPLLTPDRDANGNRLFMKTAIEMVQRATQKLYIQNQSFTLTEHNNPEFDQFFEAVKNKQRTIRDVRIIFRDARDYPRPSDWEKQQKLIERLKTFGLDVRREAMRLQSKCHTKGIIVDSSEVLLGSQNLTNDGALFNRDASLLVRSEKVAQFYEKIFLYDWENLTHNNANERVGGVRRAKPEEPTPAGFRRVRLAELLRMQ